MVEARDIYRTDLQKKSKNPHPINVANYNFDNN